MGNALSANHPESNAVGVDPTPARRDNRRACLRALNRTGLAVAAGCLPACWLAGASPGVLKDMTDYYG